MIELNKDDYFKIEGRFCNLFKRGAALKMLNKLLGSKQLFTCLLMFHCLHLHKNWRFMIEKLSVCRNSNGTVLMYYSLSILRFSTTSKSVCRWHTAINSMIWTHIKHYGHSCRSPFCLSCAQNTFESSNYLQAAHLLNILYDPAASSTDSVRRVSHWDTQQKFLSSSSTGADEKNWCCIS